MSTLIAVSTFKKPEALKGNLNSLLEHNYHEGNKVLVSDDDNQSSFKALDEFKGKLDLAYISSERKGIWANKNRCIYYFLEKDKSDHLVLSDDDIKLLRPGLLDYAIRVLRDTKEPHITMYLGGQVDFLTGNGHFHVFPILAQTDDVLWTQGCQGIFTLYSRECIEKIGYFNKMPYFYGMEHTLHSARALRMYGKSPDLYPMLASSPKFIRCQGIANNYEVDREKISNQNGIAFQKLMVTIRNGEGLLVDDPGFKPKKETIKEL